MELYWGSGSPYAWRAMLGLLFKGIRYEDHQLSFSSREHKSAHYTRLNPRGKVPTLVDGETVVTESLAILAYLDRAHPRKLLFGGSRGEAARIWQGVMEFENYLEGPGQDVIRSLYFQRWKDRIPELREAVSTTFDELDLAERACVDGGAFNALDCVYVPFLESLLRASRKDGAGEVGLQPLDLQRWPKLLARLERVRALDGFEATYPPHWR